MPPLAYTVFYLVGLAPYRSDFHHSWPATLYSILIAVLIIFGSGRFIIFEFLPVLGTPGLSVAMVASTILSVSASTLSSVVIVLWTSLTSRHHLKTVTEKLEAVDRVLAPHVKAKNNGRNRRTNVKLAIVGLSVTLLNMHDLLFIADITNLVYVRFIMYLVIFYTCFHYTVIVGDLEVRYKQINNCLKYQQIQDRRFKNGVSKIAWNEVEHNTQPQQTSQKSLRNFRRAHIILYETSLTVNSQFGIRMFAVLLHVLVSIIAFVFVFILLTFIRPPSKTSSAENPGKPSVSLPSGVTHYAVTALGWCFINLAALVATSTSGQSAAEESCRTTSLVEGLSCDELLGEDSRVELQLFGRQLLMTKASFSACKIFALDATLLLSVVATVTSYSIILLTSG